MSNRIYNIEVTQRPDAVNGDWSEPRFRAIVVDPSGDGVVTEAGTAKAAVTKALTKIERVNQPEVTETHESSPSVAIRSESPAPSRLTQAVATGDIPVLLTEAIEDKAPVDIRYKGDTDVYAQWRCIEPHSLDRVGHGWDKVVSAWCRKANAHRTFRLDRIERAERR